MKNLEIFFDIFDFHACLYMHIKFRQNRTKFGSVRASFSKTGRHGISIFTNFNHLRIIFESGYMRWLLSFFLPYVHLRLTVRRVLSSPQLLYNWNVCHCIHFFGEERRSQPHASTQKKPRLKAHFHCTICRFTLFMHKDFNFGTINVKPMPKRECEVELLHSAHSVEKIYIEKGKLFLLHFT